MKVSQGYRFTVTEVLRATGSQREKAHESIYNTGTSGETSGAKTDKNQSIQTTLGQSSAYVPFIVLMKSHKV